MKEAQIRSPSSPSYRRNLFFSGREEVLLNLHERFAHAQQTTPLPAYALSGLGGIGKTQLALEYAYRFRQHYHAVCWVRAASQETLQADFSSLASLLRLPEHHQKDQKQIIAAVKRWLTTHGPSC